MDTKATVVSDIKAELRAAIEKMTPEPWYADVTRPGPGAAVCHREAVLSQATYPPVMIARHPRLEGPKKAAETVANFDGIVALRNHAPALLSRLEELEAEVAALRADAERYRWLGANEHGLRAIDGNADGSWAFGPIKEQLDRDIDLARSRTP